MTNVLVVFLFQTEYGRAYEPLKYGYSSEKHMFESLDKMVEIKNNKLYTINPFAYTKLLQDKNVIDKCVTNAAMLLVCNKIVCILYENKHCVIFS